MSDHATLNEGELPVVAPSTTNEKATLANDPSDESTPTLVAEEESTILTGRKLAIVFCALLASLLLIALDQTILATALPRIASDFNSFSQQGWISSSFILTQTAFLLIFGQVLRIWPAKLVLLACIALFEVGSIVCATAQSVNILILGRALSGVGAAGIFISMIQIIAQVTTLDKRPKLFGLFGAVFGISSIIGPLIGGAFTDSPTLTWRWCFWINVPVGAVSFLVVSLLLATSPPLGSKPEQRTLKSRINQTLHMDWVAGVLVLGAVSCLVLALNTGGNTQPWNSVTVIVAFVVAGLATIATFFWERYLGDRAMVPFAIFRSRSIYAIVVYAFMTRFCLLLFSYFIPIYYQAGRNYSATQSGVALLPTLLSVVFSVIGSGQITGKTGRYWYFLLCGPVFLCVGSGLLYTINEFTPSPNIIGYQILAGIGIGSTMQTTLIAMQAEFRSKSDAKLLGQATGMASFGQFLGGTVGLAVAEAVFSSELTKNLALYAPTAPLSVIQQSPLSIYTLSPPALIVEVVKAYVKALDIVYILGVPIGAMSIGLALLIRNIDIRPAKEDHGSESVPEVNQSQEVKAGDEVKQV